MRVFLSCCVAAACGWMAAKAIGLHDWFGVAISAVAFGVGQMVVLGSRVRR